VEEVKEKYVWFVAVLFIFLVYFSSANLFSPKNYQDYPDTFYSTNVDSTTVKGEYMPIWVHTLPGHMPSAKVNIAEKAGIVSSLISNGNKINVTIQMIKSGIVQINTVYFPGWEAYVDGKQQKISYNNPYGLMQIPLKTGKHTVLVTFTETRERLFSDILSIVSLLTAGIIFLWEKRKHTARH